MRFIDQFRHQRHTACMNRQSINTQIKDKLTITKYKSMFDNCHQFYCFSTLNKSVNLSLSESAYLLLFMLR